MIARNATTWVSPTGVVTGVTRTRQDVTPGRLTVAAITRVLPFVLPVDFSNWSKRSSKSPSANESRSLRTMMPLPLGEHAPRDRIRVDDPAFAVEQHDAAIELVEDRLGRGE